jgi:antitoxin MazE
MTISSANTNSREGWAEEFGLVIENDEAGENEDMLNDVSNAFDDSEWIW